MVTRAFAARTQRPNAQLARADELHLFGHRARCGRHGGRVLAGRIGGERAKPRAARPRLRLGFDAHAAIAADYFAAHHVLGGGGIGEPVVAVERERARGAVEPRGEALAWIAALRAKRAERRTGRATPNPSFIAAVATAMDCASGFAQRASTDKPLNPSHARWDLTSQITNSQAQQTRILPLLP